MSVIDALGGKKPREPNGATIVAISSEIDPYVARAIESECAAVRSTAKGARNDRLNRAAFALGQLVGAGAAAEQLVADHLRAAAAACGLTESESASTIASGLNAGKAEPREIPERPKRIAPRARSESNETPPAPIVMPTAWPMLGATEIFAPLPPVDFLIEALDLCPGAPALLAGYGYSGKTVAAQALALAVATGARAWDSFSVRRGRVLHVDYEQGERLCRQRYQRLSIGMGVGPSDIGDRLVLVPMPQIYLDGAGESALVERLSGFDLCVIDSLRAACPTVEENDSGVRLVLDVLNRASERANCAVVIIHHARKPSQNAAGGAKMAIRGSGAIFDACGSVLVFEGEKDRPTRVSHEKARVSGRLLDDFTIEISDVEHCGEPRGGLSVTARTALSRDLADEAAQVARERARNERVVAEVRSLFEREPEQGGADSIAAKLGRNAGAVRRAVALLVEAGEVETVGPKTARRHRAAGRT